MTDYEYIIVGSGIAGLMSALFATEKITQEKNTKNKKILIVSKKSIRCSSNTSLAQGGIAAVLSHDDSIHDHFTDTLKAGHFLNSKKIVKFIVSHAPEIIHQLESIGIKFAKTTNGNYDLKLEGGHSHNRIVYHKDFIGQHLVDVLYKHLRTKSYITFMPHHHVIDLIVSNKICYGISLFEKQGSRYCTKFLLSHKTILATGGIGQLFSKTTNPSTATGDGIAMAIRSKTKLKDISYIQFHPTALSVSQKGRLFLLSETLRGEGAHLLNKNLVRFMKKAHPQAELAPRDIISRQIFKQLENGPVYLDLRHIDSKILKKKYPTIYRELIKNNLDPRKKLLPITPAAHYLCGGIKTDINAETSIKNLFAVGECACTGLHGSNRLASNSLLEAAVMARQAIFAKNTIPPSPHAQISVLTSAQQKPKPQKNASHKELIKAIMWKCFHPQTKEITIKNSLERIKLLNSQHEIHDPHTLEIKNMLQTAEAILIHLLDR